MSEPYWVPLGAAPPGGGAWMTGDTKVSMQAASHADPNGGMWLLADGSAIPAQYTGLIALAGANLPDAKGRTLVMLGTHTEVNAVGKSDGVALASRQPKHKHGGSSAFAQSGTDRAAFGPGYTFYTTPDASTAMVDTPAFVVVGNLFIHT